jgi:nicotinamide riboside kinase
MNKTLRRIAILGPESTGKSTLAETLAAHFGGKWVPEYARTYLAGLTRPYREEDVWHCALTQQQWESECIMSTNHLVFFDTEMINFKVWLSEKYGHYPEWILAGLSSRYDFYILTSPDLPFEPDPLREHPDRRDYFFEVYRKEIESAGFPYGIISGIGPSRTANAVRLIETWIATNNPSQ